ncbi:MAG: sugar transferase [Candidatus Binataceae bacterium]
MMQRKGFFAWPERRATDIAGWPAHYAALLFSSLILWGAASACLQIHQHQHPARPPCTFRQLLRTIVLWLGATGAAIFLLKLRSLSRQFTVSYLTLAAAAIVSRHLCETYARNCVAHLMGGRTAIVFGRSDESIGLRNMLARSHAYDSVFQGSGMEIFSGPLLNGDAGGDTAKTDSTPDTFVLAAGGEAAIVEETILHLLKQHGVVHVVPALIDTALFRYSLGEISGVPVITLASGRLEPWQAALKRVVDVALALLALIILSPLMVIITLAIKVTSAGPVFFRQERLGKDGRRFRIYKFRTMQADAEALLRADPKLYTRYLANNFKLPKQEDFRVTPVGRLLRSSSLDEFPQLINVLRGDMSLVGPRPIVPEEIERYSDFAKLLLSVKPGMTGYWQVNGRSLISDYAARVRLDMEYIRDQSLRSDFQILLKTVSAVTRMEGAH